MQTLEQQACHITHKAAVDHSLDQGFFHSQRTSVSEAIKHPERMKVLRYILDNHQSDHEHRLLTNPGPMWRFERAVEAELGEYEASFVGVENKWSVLEYSLRHMPGKAKRQFELECSKQANIVGYVSAKAVLAYSDVEFFPERIAQAKGQSLKTFQFGTVSGVGRRRKRRSTSSLRTAAGRITGCWIDIWSALGRPPVAMMLRRLPGRFVSDVAPVCFTFQYGRDQLSCGGGLDTRCEMMAAEMSHSGGSFQVDDAWHYYGHNGTRLATICGLWSRRAPLNVEGKE